MSTASRLEEILQRIQTMTPEEKRDMAKKMISAVNSMAFDVVAHHHSAQAQGRQMLSEQEMAQIVQGGVDLMNNPSTQIGH